MLNDDNDDVLLCYKRKDMFGRVCLGCMLPEKEKQKETSCVTIETFLIETYLSLNINNILNNTSHYL